MKSIIMRIETIKTAAAGRLIIPALQIYHAGEIWRVYYG